MLGMMIPYCVWFRNLIFPLLLYSKVIVETLCNDVVSSPFLNQVNGELGRDPFEVGRKLQWCHVAVEVTLQPQSLELCLGVGDKPTESLWVRIEEQTALGNIVVSVCCGTPDQEEEVDEAFKQLETTSCIAVFGPCGEIQPLRYLLEDQHSRA